MSDRLVIKDNFNIEEFQYTQILNMYIQDKVREIKAKNERAREWNDKNRKNRKKIIAVHANSVKTFAVKSVDAFILHLKRGSSDDRAEAKLLEVEREYIRKSEKNYLADRIRLTTGMAVGGEYSLDEAGKAIGVTRQRAEQLEKEALRKIKSPKVGKHLKEAKYA